MESELNGWLSPDGEYWNVVRVEDLENFAITLQKFKGILPVVDPALPYLTAIGSRLLHIKGYIQFIGSDKTSKRDTGSFVLFPEILDNTLNITNKQLEWLKENMHKMSTMQKDHCIEYLNL